MNDSQWYWCLTHQRPEPSGSQDDPDNVLGPYPSEAAARDWKAHAEAHEEAWKAGDDEDDDEG